MRILHITEAFGGGIITVLNSISRGQAENDAEVDVFYLPRSQAPSEETVRSQFHPDVHLRRMSVHRRTLVTYMALALTIRRAITSRRYDVIHLHSSKAGVIGRLAMLTARRTCKVFYSPHGFAFLQLDMNRGVRTVSLMIERMLARIGDGPILTSPSEYSLAQEKLHPPRLFNLRTGIPASQIRAKTTGSSFAESRPLMVAMVGRICYQKAPWRFAKVAERLSDQASFFWIGDGPADLAEKWLGGGPVVITGWMNPAELETMLDAIDILVFPTLWEGMSLALMQAQAQGIPAIVSNAVGNVDSVVHGETGYICDSDDDFIEKTRLLLSDSGLRERMSSASLDWAMLSLTDENVGRDSLRIYGMTVRRAVQEKPFLSSETNVSGGKVASNPTPV
ncbi:glycosyltransferase [Cryobacterium frigoriphilum]|uniref:D-inositol 3-phosphate glycosyltransferase n=1 Tax=Cryobacterium frigoriphilum TaxID=1259150 RepID=A0A4R9A0E0_9MICO|nr:glycosyltransferase [Cryobacterium frigoriphilum]TFD49806.1 glycosyltransferase [Cryobacterium frigoriphilum]